MKIKCLKCETVYEAEQGQCPSCGGRGGYVQEPKQKQVGNLSVHLEDTLVHSPSNNEYQIKEIQGEGLIAIMTKTILPAMMGKRVYISNTQINEYKVKK